ncbi:MAG: hypothetical protein RIA64_06580 [Rhodospirillales bacterium]
MKVRELQEILSKLDSELDLVFYCEDEKFLAEKRAFVLFDLIATTQTDAQPVRLDDETPYLDLGRTDTSSPIALIEITSDF